MNKKQRAIAKGVAAGATFAVALGDIIDSFAQQKNHPAWYEHYPLESLVSLNFGLREDCEQGHTVVLFGNGSDGNVNNPVNFRKPTDASILIELADGLANGRNVVDEAAELVLQQMRSIATTTAPYTKVEVANYIRNARAIVALYSICRRLADSVGLADAYDVQASTKYLALQMRAYSGNVDVAPFVNNIAQFKARLGAITPRIRNLIPANMDLMERTKWLFSNIFCDSPSAKFSTKTFTCATFYMYGDNATEARKYRIGHSGGDAGDWQGSGTTADPYKSVTLSSITTAMWSNPQSVLDALENMIDFMMSQVSTSKVAGDLLKAFGQRAFMDFPDFNPNARVPFVYDEDVLNQIQNLTVAHPAHDMMGQPIFTGRTLISEPDGVKTLSEFAEHIITTYRDTITPGRLLSLTRLCPYAERTTKYVGDASTMQRLALFTTYGTEIPVSYAYLHVRYSANSQYGFIAAIPHDTLFVSDAQVGAMWAADDWAPAMVEYHPATGGSPQFVSIDAQNWTTMNAKDAASYHELATLSLCLIHEVVQKTDTFVFVN